MLSKSIAMAATLRVRRTREPLAETSMFSPMLEPLKLRAFAAALAFDGVAAVARIPLEAVVAGAEQCGVRTDVAVDEVVAAAAEQQIGAVAAAQRVVAGAAVERQVGQRRRCRSGR